MREWYSKHLGLADKGQGAMLPWREHDDPQKEHVTVRRDFAVFPVQGQRGLRRLRRYFGDKMSVGAQMVVALKAFVERSVSLVLGHPFEFSWLDVSQTDVFHCSSPLWWEPAAQPCPLVRSSYSRRGQGKSTAEAEYSLFQFLVRSRCAKSEQWQLTIRRKRLSSST